MYFGDSQPTALDFLDNILGTITQDVVKENQVLYGAETITENDLEMSSNQEDTPVVTKLSTASISSPVGTTKPPMETTNPPHGNHQTLCDNHQISHGA